MDLDDDNGLFDVTEVSSEGEDTVPVGGSSREHLVDILLAIRDQLVWEGRADGPLLGILCECGKKFEYPTMGDIPEESAMCDDCGRWLIAYGDVSAIRGEDE